MYLFETLLPYTHILASKIFNIIAPLFVLDAIEED